MDAEIHKVFNDVLTVVVSAGISAISIYVSKWLKKLGRKADGERLGHAAMTIVRAAAQTYDESGHSEEKKADAVKFLTKQFPGVKAEVIDAAIEAAVHRLKAGLDA